MFQNIKDESLQKIINNLYSGIFGQIIILIGFWYIFVNKISNEMLLLGISAHIILILSRVYFAHRYSIDKNKVKFILLYSISLCLSATAWASLLIFIQDLSIEYHFMVYTILICITSVALFSFGEVLFMYLLFVIPIFLISSTWFFIQDSNKLYTVTFYFSIAIFIYFYITAKKYNRRYLDMLNEREKSNKLLNELEEKSNTLDKQANYDSLTSLPNRILFHDRLTQGIIKAKRRDTKLALFFLDIDNFKQINDSLGHETGDDVLKHFSKLIKCQIRSEDTLARLGGDEFIMILENIDSIEDASLLAQKIVNTMVEPMIINGNYLSLSASIGISIYPQDAIDKKNLLKYADVAMYKAKENGRNNFQFYSSKMSDMVIERLGMGDSLRNAIINNEFIVHYQPKIDVKSSKIIGLEALVRWQHPTIGFLLPNKFIPIAKKLGLMADIDEIVRKIAMSQVACWYEAGLNPGNLSLNLSTKQLDKENLINDMKGVGFKSKWLELEVAEKDIMNDPQKVIKKLKEINDLGIKIVIDDFGTGYSSLPYLKRLPITKLKIDQSLIKDISNVQDDKDIVKVIIALSESLNIDIIAKGIETIQQRDFLAENGCFNIQGFYYAKPLPVKEIEKLIKIGKIDVR